MHNLLTSRGAQRTGGQSGPANPALPASTRCMIILKLQWKIFQMVDDTESEFSRSQTLLALALTCKSFTGPALDLLWRELYGFAPLIRCLPQSLWKQDNLKLEFERTMTSEI
ncbi:hypothetical protein DFH29DRAFT_272260 [Suillus ampliporus]|nr:hypothetical protein DFH29DRAFT_272260 [Suillus ampliporus]